MPPHSVSSCLLCLSAVQTHRFCYILNIYATHSGLYQSADFMDGAVPRPSGSPFSACPDSVQWISTSFPKLARGCGAIGFQISKIICVLFYRMQYLRQEDTHHHNMWQQLCVDFTEVLTLQYSAIFRLLCITRSILSSFNISSITQPRTTSVPMLSAPTAH